MARDLINRAEVLVIILMTSFIAGCGSLPSLEGRTASSALTESAATRLGRAVAPGVVANPGKAGLHGLLNPHDALGVRVLLAAAADKSLDVQYYIWHKDQVGVLLFEAMWQAAQRGVHVRLLLDDLNTSGLDPTIAVLDAHPNIEVRLFNPLVQRNARALNFLTDFARVNRRMHNKSFTADNQVSVLGGRNIGNEYFGGRGGVGFVDLDVMAMGQPVQEVSRQFDLYWNSPSAYPAGSLVGAPGPDGVATMEAMFRTMRADSESVAYLETIRSTPFVRELLQGQLPLEWTTARVMYDDPAKTLDTTGRTDVLLFPELVRTIGQPDRTLDLVSPYFVPGAEGTSALGALAAKGVKVRILTNSLAASDVKAVHAGYVKRRIDLLRAGVRLFELKPSAVQPSGDQPKRGGGSSSSLHAKTFAVDQNRIFVGSFNFDQRSAQLNTELGVVIDSPVLAQRLGAFFDTEVPMVAYEVRLTQGNDLQWIEYTSSGVTTHEADPGTSWLLRRQIDFLSILPIEWLL